jgi:hypothetical protein
MHAPISFAPASSPDAASFAPAAADVGGAVCLGYGIAIAVGVLVFISTVMLASYICVRAKAGAAAVLLADDDGGEAERLEAAEAQADLLRDRLRLAVISIATSEGKKAGMEVSDPVVACIADLAYKTVGTYKYE